ncbi:MAG: PilZ domain-containing protein [Deltaproteobacteria bacterium]|nr:MAG: PilZ domain-containing protein [Deltaproteobacteria bacterium]
MVVTKGKKKHRFTKVKASYPVVVLTADGPVEGETQHITPQETFVRCRDPLRLYDIASLSIKVSKHESLLAEGEVVLSNRYGPDDEITPRGMTVRFINLSARDRLRLRTLIARHYQRKVRQIAGEA